MEAIGDLGEDIADHNQVGTCGAKGIDGDEDVDDNARDRTGGGGRTRIKGGRAADAVGDLAEEVDTDHGEDRRDDQKHDTANHSGLAERARQTEDARTERGVEQHEGDRRDGGLTLLWCVTAS